VHLPCTNTIIIIIIILCESKNWTLFHLVQFFDSQYTCIYNMHKFSNDTESEALKYVEFVALIYDPLTVHILDT